MNINDRISIKGVNYVVTGTIGAGGQGAVWKVKNSNDGKIYALKLINEKDANKRRNKISNIQRLIKEKLDEKTADEGARVGVNHVFPISEYNNQSAGETGYIMECASGKTLNKMLDEGTIAKMSIKDKLVLVQKIAKSIDMLHSRGYCYTDINWGNFMWDEKQSIISVIDCENAACTADINDGTCSFLVGTGFFIAPEVAFGKSHVSYYSDRYALATLIFRILTNNVLQSAYHGKAMYSASPACLNMLDVAEYEDEDEIDKNWRHFVFDRTNRSNGLDDLFKGAKNPENIAFRREIEKIIPIWNGLDDRLKDLFYKAFTDPFDVKSRPLPSAWIRTIDVVLGKKQPPRPVPPRPIPPKPVPPKPVKPQPYLISSSGKKDQITADDYLVEGDKFGLSKRIIGSLKKNDSVYVFTSKMLSAVNILDSTGAVKQQLSKGQSAELLNGESINPATTRTSIKIVY